MTSKYDNLSHPVLHDHLSCELLLTTFCNMRCVYCIARDLPASIMSAETGRKAIDMFVDLAKGASSLEITFTGGEPLLEFKTMRYLTFYAQKRASQIGACTSFVIKTNGTILNQTILDFVNANNIEMVVSIDGIPENHDEYRKDLAQNGTHHIVCSNLKVILQNAIPCIASITVHPRLCKTVLDSVCYLYNLGVEKIDLGPAYGTVKWTKNEGFVFSKSIHDVAIYMKEMITAGKNIEVGPIYKESEHVGEILSEHWGCSALSTNIAFLPEGQITGCSALAMLITRYPNLVLGNVWKGLEDRTSKNLLQLTLAGIQKRPSCQKCEASANCKGGCLAINLSTSESPFRPPNFYCCAMRTIPNAWQTAWENEN